MKYQDLIEGLEKYYGSPVKLAKLLEEKQRLQYALDWLFDCCEAAIKSGDWEVDGACDPDLETFKCRMGVEDGS